MVNATTPSDLSFYRLLHHDISLKFLSVNAATLINLSFARVSYYYISLGNTQRNNSHSFSSPFRGIINVVPLVYHYAAIFIFFVRSYST